MKCDYCDYPYAYVKYSLTKDYSYIYCPNCRHTGHYKSVYKNYQNDLKSENKKWYP